MEEFWLKLNEVYPTPNEDPGGTRKSSWLCRKVFAQQRSGHHAFAMTFGFHSWSNKFEWLKFQQGPYGICNGVSFLYISCEPDWLEDKDLLSRCPLQYSYHISLVQTVQIQHWIYHVMQVVIWPIVKIHYLLQNFDFLMVIIAWEPFHDASCDGLRMVLLRMCHGRDSGVETSFLLESKVCPQLARSNEVRFGARNVSHQCQLKILEFISYRTSRFFFCFSSFSVSTSAS